MINNGRELKGEIYQIRVQGVLDAKWNDYFNGFDISSQDQGETLLSGNVVDQAALHGVLGKIRDLGLSLISVARVGTIDPKNER